jgi:2'-hydroxyisoflavone reductase
MKILIIGGTKFLGRHLVEAALSRGHQLTLFNRGRTNSHLFPNVEQLCGDRDGNLDTLKNRQWDALIDTCGYVPKQVQATARLLADAARHYTFISSISVYRDFSEAGLNEDAPVATLPSGTNENEINSEHYGAKKALCERAAEAVMPGRVLIIRPGILAGPYDPTNRFTRWVLRTAHGGEVLCPAPATAPLQIIDARDLAGWIIRMVEARQTGCFNAIGPATTLTFQHMLEQCKTASGSDAHFTWVDEQFLLDHKVDPSRDLPLWIPKMETSYSGFYAVDCRRALKCGLAFRPLSDTARDVLDTLQGYANGSKAPISTGLSTGREAELLQTWKTGVHA